MSDAGHLRRELVLAICCMSMLIVGLDVTILNVALPSIQRDFGASVSGAQWTIDAYTLVIACLLMLAGSTGDRLGRRRTFQVGLLTFTVGSLLCSIAPGLGWLIGFRMVQAVGGSMLNPVAMSIVTNVFTEPRERARAIGWWGGVAGVSIASGPLVGGLLVQAIDWRAVFWINVPVGIAAILLTAKFVPESRAPHPRRLDPIGQVLMILALGLLVFGIIEAPNHGWGSDLILACFAGSLVAGSLLVFFESRHPEPLIDLRFFRSPPFSGAAIVSICAFLAMGGFLFLSTLYLQDVRGYSALHAGVALLPMAVLMMVFSPLSGRVVGHRGPRPSLVIGGAAVLAAGLVAALPTSEPGDARLILAYALVGTGLGWVNAAITNTAVAGMPREQAGVAAAVASTTRQLGSALGVAVIGSVIADHVTEVTAGPAFTSASRVSWAIIALCGLIALGVGGLTTGAWGRRRAKANAARMEQAIAPLGEDRAPALG
ncbi:MAG TPA: DHA2 family efflux MFS transporter permease subunit [Solirubrobacterales bacterium]|nr:DHA2 family efflux MFS transporter permease subunit [Solirubrobacterales bacterium]